MQTLIVWVPRLPWSEIYGLVESCEFWARSDVSTVFLLHLLFPSPQSHADWIEKFWRESTARASLVLRLFLLSLPWSYGSLWLLAALMVLGLSLNKCAHSGDGMCIPQTSSTDSPV